ncbi:MAG: hypothetical protein HYS27_25505 [Deltaproteobacteria bacterium]|nr:hypothetical protein [Deltaproteobacteria bacterium]
MIAALAAGTVAAACAAGVATTVPAVVAAPPAPAPRVPAPPATAFGPALRSGVASARREAARVVIDAALAPDADVRWRKRRSLVFSEAGAVFALDDAWSLLAQAPRPRRAGLLAAMAPALSERATIDQEERTRLAAAAAAAGTTPHAWYAGRAGIHGRALASLIDAVLVATGELLGPVAGDVTLAPDVLTPPAWAARRDPAAKPAVDLTAVNAWAVFYGDVPRPPSADDAAAYARALTVEVRLAALSILALQAAPAGHDALASRALLDDAEVVPGSAALLDLDVAGTAVERFVGLLRAPAVARARWAGEPLTAVIARLEAAPPPDQEGYPEAFVAVARLLPDAIR